MNKELTKNNSWYKELCKQCNKEFLVENWRKGKAKYCSMFCRGKNNKNLFKIGHLFLGNKEILQKWIKENGAWNKNKPHLKIRGKKHWNWKDGITSLNVKIRNSLKYSK